jgi:hypothetical protein
MDVNPCTAVDPVTPMLEKVAEAFGAESANSRKGDTRCAL